MSAPGTVCAQHMTQAHARAHKLHLSPTQVNCPPVLNPSLGLAHPQKGQDLVSCLSTTLTSMLVDGWVLDSIACLVNKGLVVCTLPFCILCQAPLGHRHFTG